VLDQILSGKNREDIIISLNEYLSDIGKRMKDRKVPLSQYIITKQLTRAPKDYHDDKSLPHVAVAKR
jgi:DNA polymerase alpha subunit A